MRKLREEGKSYEEIGNIFGVSKQAISLAHPYIPRKKERKLALMLIPAKLMKRNLYHCFRCKQHFQSQLESDEAICIKCGSSKIKTIIKVRTKQ